MKVLYIVNIHGNISIFYVYTVTPFTSVSRCVTSVSSLLVTYRTSVKIHFLEFFGLNMDVNALDGLKKQVNVKVN